MISSVDLKCAKWKNRGLRHESMEAVMIFFT
jgi:hypothetical protein